MGGSGCSFILAFVILCSASPRFFIGPTTNTKGVGEQTLALFEADVSKWNASRHAIVSSGGAIHLRQMIMNSYSAAELTSIAKQSAALGLKMSIEAGGYLCRTSGKESAQATLRMLQPFLEAEGALSFWLMESVFSRMSVGCPSNFTLADAIDEVVDYAEAIKAALPGTEVWLYDALPHYSVGAAWPPNEQHGVFHMDLPDILTRLKARLGKSLSGYMADCPYEYSIQYPLPGKGFQRIAAAHSAVKDLDLLFGKTMNSQEGGQTSDQMFFERTLDDWRRTRAVMSEACFDIVMVESWYSHPINAAPETLLYSTTYTANMVARNMSCVHVAQP